MPPVIAAVAAVVGAIGAAVGTVATFAEAIAETVTAGLGLATAHAIGVGVFALVSAGLPMAALMGVSSLLKPHLDVGGAGSQVAFKADPQAAVPFVVGRTGTGGNIVFNAADGTKNQDLTYVTVLSAGGPVNSIESFAVDGTVLAFNGSGACTTAPYASPPLMWQKTQLGAAGASALTIAGGPAIPPEWSTSEKLSGKAASIWTLRLDANNLAATPTPLWVLKGAPVYDPRLDSTYPGGSGSQRLATPSTWAWSENPFLHGLNWCLGIYENGKRIMGVGAPIAAIVMAAFVEGANVADANAWKVGGVVYSTDDKYDVLTAMLQAGGGVPLKLGAQLSCFVNTPRVSLATLTGADVVGDVSIGAAQSRRTRINKIWPSYREETAGWQMTPTVDPVTVSTYVTEDGEERSRQVDYQLVQDANQVSQLARLDIENGREFGPCSFPCKPRWWGYKPGDCITVNEPEYGLNGQLVLIVDRQIDPATMAVTLTCRSETSAKYPFILGQTGTAPPSPGITGIDPYFVPTPGGSAWAMTGSSFVGAGQAPALIIDGAADNPNVGDVLVDWRERLTTAPTWGPWSTMSFPASATRLVIPGVKDTTYYGAQVRYRNLRGAQDFSAALDLGVVETGTIEIADQGLLATLDDIEDAQLAAGVGVNCLVDTQFSQGSNWWRPDGDAGHTDTYPVSGNGVHWAKVVNTGGSVGQQIRFGSDNQVNSLPIKPGDRIEVQAVVGGHGCSSIFIEARWLDATGHNIGGASLATTCQTVTSYGAGGGEVDSGTLIGGVATAPAGAYRVMFVVIGVVGTGGSGNAWIFVTQPMLAKAKSGSSALSQFNQGFLGEPGADITSGNIAAGITGQAATATSSDFAAVTGSTKPANNATVGAVTGSNLVSPVHGVQADGDVITGEGIAAGFTGQAGAATDNTIEAGATFNGLYISTSDPAPVPNGALWYDPSSGIFKARSSGAWHVVAGDLLDGTIMMHTEQGGTSGTFTVPNNAQPFCTVTVTGGAGGDGFESSSLGLGGQGGTCSFHFAVTPGSTTISWVCGAAGAGNAFAGGANGSASTATSTAFSGTMTGGGGSGGGNGTAGAGGGASGPSGSTNTSGASGVPTGSAISIVTHSS